MKFFAILHEKGNWDDDAFFTIDGDTMEEMLRRAAAYRGLCPMLTWFHCKNENTALRLYKEYSKAR